MHPNSARLFSVLLLSVFSLFSNLAKAQSSCQTTIDSAYLAVDVNSYIHINGEAGVFAKRDSLINRIWKDGLGLRSTFPDGIGLDLGSWEFIDTTNYPNLERLDKYTIDMDLGFSATVYVCNPKIPTNKVMIVHEGHTPWYASGIQETIEYYLNKGYTILYMNMPLTYMNTGPVNFHDDMAALETDTLNPLKFFFEPITRSLNYILDNQPYDEVSMIGVSGGGWITVLYASMDTRIKSSYSVAGTLPSFLKGPPCGNGYLGDYEQAATEIPDTLSRLDLYIMCSHGEGRKHVQIINQFDPCCNGGILYQVYRDIVEDRVNCMHSGQFSTFLDTTHTDHKISDVALAHINSINCDSAVVLSSPTDDYVRGLHEIVSFNTISAENKISDKARTLLDAKEAVTFLSGFEVKASDCSSFVAKAGKGCN